MSFQVLQSQGALITILLFSLISLLISLTDLSESKERSCTAEQLQEVHALHVSSLPAARRLSQGRYNMQMNEEKASVNT